MICDFCNQPDPEFSYPCPRIDGAALLMGADDKVTDMVDFSMEADWAACAECADLVDADDFDGLLTRSLEAFRRQHGRDFDPNIVDGLKVLWQAFNERRGEREPI